MDDIIGKAMRMYDLKEQIDELERVRKGLQKEYDNIRNETLPDLMDSAEIPRVTLGKIGRTVILAPEVYTSILDPRLGYEWLRQNGYGGLITQYIHPSTFRAFAKELLKEGVELPEDLFKVTPFTQARLRKA